MLDINPFFVSFLKIPLNPGTGLTPCLQVMRCILEGEDKDGDITTFTLFFQNRKEEDILLQEELQSLAAKYPSRVEIIYFLSNASDSAWGTALNQKKGYINAAAVNEFMRPDNCQLVCLCGPSGFNEAMKQLLVDAGHSDNSLYVW